MGVPSAETRRRKFFQSWGRERRDRTVTQPFAVGHRLSRPADIFHWFKEECMRHGLLAASVACALGTIASPFPAVAHDDPAGEGGAETFRLSGWAAIPSTFRRPGPVSGQFQTGANGVTPPYDGQPIPGFSGVIPSRFPAS